MATQLAPLFVRVGADIKGYTAGMAKVQAGAKTTGKVVAAASKLAAGAIIGIAIAAIDAAADFERATSIIRKGTGATGEALKGLQRDFKAVFGTVPEDAEKVGTAIADLNTRLGLTGAPLQKMTKLMLDFARVSEEEVSETIRKSTRVFGDWGVSVSKQEDTLNLLLRASQNSGIAISALTGTLVQFGAPLRQVGFTLENSVALLSKWEQEGVNVEAILGSLKISIGKFATAGKDAGAAFQEALKKISEAETDAEANAISLETVGSRAMADFASAIKESRFDIEDFQKALAANTDTIQDAAEASLTSGERMMRAWRGVQGTLVEVGEVLLPVIEGIVEGAATVVKFLAPAFKVLVDVLVEVQKAVKEVFNAITLGLADALSAFAAAETATRQLTSGFTGALEDVGEIIRAEFGKASRQELEKWIARLESAIKSQMSFSGTLNDTSQEYKDIRQRIKEMRTALGRATIALLTAGDAAEEAAGGIENLGKSLTSAFIEFSGAQAEASRTTQQLEADLADLALEMSKVRDFFFDFTGMIDPRALGGPLAAFRGLTDLFGKDLPQAFVKGWNLIVLPAIAKLPAQTKSSLSADMGDAFIDGFQGAMKNIQDIWKAFTIGLGQALSEALSKKLGTGFFASIAGSIGGALIGSAVGFLGSLFGGGGKVDLGLPTFAEAQAILAQRALEAAEALASIKDEIADTNVSIFRAKLSLDQFRDSLQEARKAQRDAARAIKAVGDEFAIAQQRTFRLTGGGAKTEIVGTLTGGEALAELQRLIDAAIGTGKLGFISRREQKEILELVQGTENEILAKQLVEAAAATALIRADFELQKLQLKNLRKARQFARDTLTEMTSVVAAVDSSKDAIVDAIENIPAFQTGTRFVPQTGLAIVHRGEQIIPARGERGIAGIDAGGGRPTSLTANIFLDGKLVESVVVPVMEDAIASRETSIRVNTRERRG